MLCVRRALDAEGWDADVALLRKQLAAVERRLVQTRLAARLDGAAAKPYSISICICCDIMGFTQPPHAPSCRPAW